MTVKRSIECWIISNDQDEILLLTVPEKPNKRPAFNQPITGGMEGDETPEEACVREVFEETGRRIEVKELINVKDEFMVKIDDDLTINKTIFAFKTDFFTPALSPTEHSDYKWVKCTELDSHLFYQSNKDTWAFVNDVCING